MNFSFFFILLTVLVPIICIDHALSLKLIKWVENNKIKWNLSENSNKKKVNVDLIIDGPY